MPFEDLQLARTGPGADGQRQVVVEVVDDHVDVDGLLPVDLGVADRQFLAVPPEHLHQGLKRGWGWGSFTSEEGGRNKAQMISYHDSDGQKMTDDETMLTISRLHFRSCSQSSVKKSDMRSGNQECKTSEHRNAQIFGIRPTINLILE